MHHSIIFCYYWNCWN